MVINIGDNTWPNGSLEGKASRISVVVFFPPPDEAPRYFSSLESEAVSFSLLFSFSSVFGLISQLWILVNRRLKLH